MDWNTILVLLMLVSWFAAGGVVAAIIWHLTTGGSRK